MYLISKTSLTQKSRKLFKNTMNRSILRKSLLLPMAMIAFALAFYTCDNKDSGEAKVDHDPAKNIRITKFEPDSGRVRDMVIVHGENFGSDAANIKVYFNHVEARVIGASASGDKFMVVVPRLPVVSEGDDCFIHVRVGGTSVADGSGYQGGKTANTEHLGSFRYKIAANITTIAGNGGGQNPSILNQGLDKAEFWPVYIAMDSEDNIFVVTDDRFLVLLNVKENLIVSLANRDNFVHPNGSMNVHPYSDLIMSGGRDSDPRDRFLFLNPKEGWAPRNKYISNWVTFPEDERPTYTNTVTGEVLTYADYVVPGTGANHSWCVWSPYPDRADDAGKREDQKTGWYYTWYFDSGIFARVDPLSMEATIVGMLPTGTNYCASVHPLRKYEIWIGAGSEGNAGEGPVRDVNGDSDVYGSWNNSVCVVDVRDVSFYYTTNATTGVQTRSYMKSGRRLTSSVTRGSWRDGRIDEAEFQRIRQLNFDPDGNLFIGDCENACLRQISTMSNPMMVSTVIGIPGQRGFKDGSPEEALFRQLHGVVSDKEGVLFVTDWNNGRVRRVAIE